MHYQGQTIIIYIYIINYSILTWNTGHSWLMSCFSQEKKVVENSQKLAPYFQYWKLNKCITYNPQRGNACPDSTRSVNFFQILDKILYTFSTLKKIKTLWRPWNNSGFHWSRMACTWSLLRKWTSFSFQVSQKRSSWPQTWLIELWATVQRRCYYCMRTVQNWTCTVWTLKMFVSCCTVIIWLLPLRMAVPDNRYRAEGFSWENVLICAI